MGFSAHSPDPQLVAEQKRQAQEAKLDRISLIQQQLGQEDLLRQSLYGTRAPLITQATSPATAGSGGTVSAGGNPWFNKSPSGQFFMKAIQAAVAK